jgi:signal transduction histidine kinase
MSIKLRFALLLGPLLLAFLAAVVLLRRAETLRGQRAIETYQRDGIRALERWVDLSGQTLRQFANDYSLWDDMVAFVESSDANWARINLEASLPNFGADALWVLDREGGVRYATSELAEAALEAPISRDDLDELTSDSPFTWFYRETEVGLLEIRGAPIQPSDDIRRTKPAVGWLFVARAWNDKLLGELGRITESRAYLTPGDEAEPPPRPNARIELLRPLNDWRGRTLRVLHIARAAPEIAQMAEGDAFQVRIFIGFGLLVIAALGLSLQRWVLSPLSRLEKSLKTGNTAPIQRLLQEPSELGRLAQLVDSSFAQRATLEREIEERRRVEEALRQSEAALRENIEERVRLGRDLHDSVIQSIYASGLGLATVHSLLRNQPAEAERRVEQVRQRLNETIRDLRNFITGLEPEALRRVSFEEAVRGLLQFLRAAASIDAVLQIDEEVAEELPVSARAELLQITREALSNVLRHAGATTVQVILRREGEEASLVIEDNGQGFDAAAMPGTGRGLRNIGDRARSANARFDLDTAPGKGTRLRLHFPLPEGSP